MKWTKDKDKFDPLHHGKIPPQAKDFEEVVLGAIMLDKEAYFQVQHILGHEVFYVNAHVEIYRAAEQLSNQRKPIDLLTIAEQLRKNGQLEEVGGAHYLSQLTQRVASTASIETWAYVIHERYMFREFIRISSQIIQKSYDDMEDVLEVYEQFSKEVDQLGYSLVKGKDYGIDKLAPEFLSNIEKAIDRRVQIENNSTEVFGIDTHLRRLNEATGGWQKTDLIIVASRPGMGKTSFLKNCIKGAMKSGVPVGLFSIEMSATQILARLMSEYLEVPANKILQGKIGKDMLVKMDDVFNEHFIKDGKPLLFIDDSNPLNLDDFKIKARRWKREEGVGMFIIDYLQLMKGSVAKRRYANSRHEDVSDLSNGCKQIAKELEVPVIALSQLSRTVETRGGTMQPILSDLRESGAIEQDADMIIFLYRPEYYLKQNIKGMDVVKLEPYGPEVDTKSLAQINIAKYRNGSTGAFWVKFKDKLTQFLDLNYNKQGEILKNDQMLVQFPGDNEEPPGEPLDLPF